MSKKGNRAITARLYHIRLLYSMATTTLSSRKQAPRPAKPAARYWKGKVPKGVTEVASDSDADEEDVVNEDDGDVFIGGEQDIVEEEDTAQAAKEIKFSLKEVKLPTVEKVIKSERDVSVEPPAEEESESDEVCHPYSA